MAEHHIDTNAVANALRKTRPSRWANPLFAAAVIAICMMVLSLVANLSLYQWGSDKSDQVETLRAESLCRSQIAADTDVAQGDFLADLGQVQLATARGLAALGSNDNSDVPALVAQLRKTSDDLSLTLDAYLTQLEARAHTAETCNS